MLLLLFFPRISLSVVIYVPSISDNVVKREIQRFRSSTAVGLEENPQLYSQSLL
jgi:hypothetical protein